MVQVLNREDDVRVTLARELSNSFAEMLPAARGDGWASGCVGGDDLHVLRFLVDVAHALRMREAELARLQGISQATQSSWKKRGAIPEHQLPWFREKLVPLILDVPRSRTLGSHGLGLNVALAIFDQTDFNPYGETFDNRAAQINACYRHLDAIANLGDFVASRLGCHYTFDGHERDVFDRIAPKTLELARLGREYRFYI